MFLDNAFRSAKLATRANFIFSVKLFYDIRDQTPEKPDTRPGDGPSKEKPFAILRGHINAQRQQVAVIEMW